jgi:hypothetical protein
VVIDNKGGEVIHKDSKMMTKEGDQLKFEHTSMGSKLINLIDAIECAFYMFACMVQVLKLNSMLV